MAIAAAILGIAAPRLLRTSDRVAMGDARMRVSTAVSSARSAAVRMGRVSTLVVDSAGGRLVVLMDTTVLGGGSPVGMSQVDLRGDLRVHVGSGHTMLCFDPRGLAVIAAGCSEHGLVVRLYRGSLADSVRISAVGRVVP